MSSPRPGVSRAILAVLLAGVWVSICEFLRNQLLLLSNWKAHFAGMGLQFPSQPTNAVMWMVWAFVFAGVVYVISRRFGFWQSAALGWVAGFLMMWVVIGNLLVLPLGILPVAVPLSIVEALGVVFICRRLAPPRGAWRFPS